ncbi:MAG: amino acid ABC transporter substrate-binding protein [Daejeonella sp.]|uniref:amino acid ABC transporter substrate-binding protein n=1 Tax=Daejeonella sp. TaxID=2805397 RepID=UPI002732B3C1|nr:amino acid ABC transporter substrate-binding protein [Daejeonella sp.]MDP3470187.1 amino acid ABC transporter substrate-binding protein [Daejeonella sp.]
MILVPNHLQRLSGNKYLIVFCILIFLSACSKKVIPTKPAEKPAPVEIVVPKLEEPVKKNIDHSIVLLLPFQLNTLNLKTSRKSDLSKADLAIDFYQGFKLGLDSLSTGGHNFNLQVFDSQNQETRIVNLAMSGSIISQDLIIGPVFPDDIKTFSEFSDLGKTLQVSPLAASMPSEFNDSELVSINNSIDQHGMKIAGFISSQYKPEQVQLILINTQKTEDSRFSNYIKSYLNELSGSKFPIIERPNTLGIEDYLSPTKINLVIITSSDRSFLLPAIDKLYRLKSQKYPIEVFGHPNWIKSRYLNPEKMQALNTRISASYFVNYKAQNVKNFIARYRDEYGLEPSEFSFKGFDTAYYFGSLLEKYDKEYADFLIKEIYTGLHNDFHFVKDPKYGYRNTALMILRYQNFELQPVR